MSEHSTTTTAPAIQYDPDAARSFLEAVYGAGPVALTFNIDAPTISESLGAIEAAGNPDIEGDLFRDENVLGVAYRGDGIAVPPTVRLTDRESVCGVWIFDAPVSTADFVAAGFVDGDCYAPIGGLAGWAVESVGERVRLGDVARVSAHADVMGLPVEFAKGPRATAGPKMWKHQKASWNSFAQSRSEEHTSELQSL